MTRFLIAFTVVAGLALGSDLWAHGGTYRGPGDTVPPAGGGAPTPTTPTAPTAPTAPSTPGAATPAAPSTPATPGVAPVPVTTTTTTAVTQGPPLGADLTTWDFWWEFNKEPFLNLKAKIHSGGQETGEGDILTGLGGAGTKSNTYKPTPSQIQGEIVPALLSALDRESSNIDLISSVVVALGKIGGNPEIPKAIRPRLSHNNQEIAETAALAYGILQTEDELELLNELLADTPAGRQAVDQQTGVPLRTRAFAAYGLGLIGNNSNNVDVRNSIAEKLWNFLSTDDSSIKDIRVASVIGLGITRLEDPTQMVKNLTSYLENGDNDFITRAHVPNAIAKLLKDADPENPQVKGSIDLFTRLLGTRDTEAEVRQSCVQALGMLTKGDSPFADKVFVTLANTMDKGRDQQEKHYATMAMAYVASDPILNNPLADKVTQVLLKKMARGSTNIRPWCAMSLGVMAFRASDQGGSVSPVVLSSVRDAFKREKAPLRKAGYAVSLGLMKNESSKKEIRDAMMELRDPGFRGYAAVALGLMGAREYKDDIRKVVEGSKRQPELLRQAAVGLGLMSDREVIGILLEMMRPDEGQRANLAVLSATATALGFIGDRSAVKPLIEMLENPEITQLARAFAAVALGIVADKELLPWNSKVAEDLNYRATVTTLVDQSSGTGILDIL